MGKWRENKYVTAVGAERRLWVVTSSPNGPEEAEVKFIMGPEYIPPQPESRWPRRLAMGVVGIAGIIGAWYLTAGSLRPR